MFEFSKALNSFADNIVSVPGIRRMVNNPIYTAITITIIILFIIMFTFRNVVSSESILSLSFRGSVYIFIFLLGAIFLHDHILMKAPKDDLFDMKLVPTDQSTVKIVIPQSENGLIIDTN